MASDIYLRTLTVYYEEEVEGEAYFHALAERLSDPDQAAKMRLLGDVETYAAEAVRPLIDKYGLTPKSAADLQASGRAAAAAQAADWDAVIGEWRRTFPGYIDDFEGLKAMAPPEDLSPLKILTDHEHAAIAFLEAEVAGQPDPAAPLRHYLATGSAVAPDGGWAAL
ncbi:MAG: hypothetical protein AAF631_02165 [Pseudomonadota bacterium]